MSADKRRKTIYKVLRMYYVDNLTQNEIANRLSISRIKVARYIYYARAHKLVETKLNFPINENDELETEFENKYGLKECRIVPSFENIEDTYKYIAIELADILGRILNDDEYVGISWGTTLEGVSRYLKLNKKINVNVIPVTGAIGIQGQDNSTNFVIKNFADKIGGRYYPIHIPNIVDSKKAKKILEADSQTRNIIELNKKLSTVILAVSAASLDTSFSRLGAFSQKDIDYLDSLGVVGILNFEFLNAAGELVENMINDRIVRVLPFESIRKIKNSILISWGPKKVEILKACIKNKNINILLTDEETARAISC